MGFQTALSGLNAASGNLNVTGNNIANSSTTGFKKARAEFADVYAVSFGGVSATATGSGVRMSNVAQQFTQGNIDFTDNNLDLAISGEGFFALNDNGEQLYTRAGNFSVDREGYVVNSHGQRLQKYDVNADGLATNFTPEDMQLNTGANPASATTGININANLDAGATPVVDASYPADYQAAPWPEPEPTDYTFSTTTTIYDSLGVTHDATLYFRKDDTMAPNEWDVTLEITDGSDGSRWVGDTETLEFNDSGELITTGDIDFLGGASTQPGQGAWTPSTGAAAFGSFNVNFDGSTQFGANSAVNDLFQDGYTTGKLSGISIDSTGVVFARYTNGQSETLGAVAMVRFANPNGLQQTGDTNWAATFDSGDALAGQAGSGNFGQIQSGALEASNVDISKELVNMIIAQRDYQANAKMISTEDQVTQTIINIR